MEFSRGYTSCGIAAEMRIQLSYMKLDTKESCKNVKQIGKYIYKYIFMLIYAWLIIFSVS